MSRLRLTEGDDALLAARRPLHEQVTQGVQPRAQQALRVARLPDALVPRSVALDELQSRLGEDADELRRGQARDVADALVVLLAEEAKLGAQEELDAAATRLDVRRREDQNTAGAQG